MSRLVTCVRPANMWRRDFERGETVDVDAFAEALERDAGWLYAKMLRPMIQVGMELVPCFEAATGGGAEDELLAKSTGPSAKDPDGTVFPKHLYGGIWEFSDGSRNTNRMKKLEAKARQAALNAASRDGTEPPEETTDST